MGVGWSDADCGYTLSLHSAAGAAIGLYVWRLRGSAVVWGRPGLILRPEVCPTTRHGRRLIIATTAVDTLALAGLGIVALGAPLVLPARNELVAFQNAQKPRDTAVLTAGELPDLRRAAAMEGILRAFHGTTRLVHAPDGCMDFATWIRAGATRENVVAAIEAAPARALR